MTFQIVTEFLTNHGSSSGQTVPHLHFHLLGGRPLGSKAGKGG